MNPAIESECSWCGRHFVAGEGHEMCRQCYQDNCVCPPFEARTTGTARYRVYIEELESKVEELETRIRALQSGVDNLLGRLEGEDIDYRPPRRKGAVL